ncbi:MAG: SMP-30/gluconolactonase/LRE family protein [Clostridia bacterium]|nr:SMP-30/gluconolactonase/LRE family protein [Clostridia bacterium]
MLTPKLFTLLPEEYVSTPDGMEIDKDGNLILSCPNFADMTMKSCVVIIDRDKNIRKWFDVPVNPKTGEARSMGIAFGPDGDLYIVDNPGWTGREDLVFTGRILRVRMNGDNIEKVTVVADGMEHPNGIRIKGNNMYVTQSTLEKVRTESGKLMSCVYRFALDDENIHVTNTLADPNIIETFITQNPKCQYGVDGIVFDREGRLIIGNFGDGAIHRLYLSEDGMKVEKNELWCCDPENLLTTDGMTIDPDGNIYVADFSANAIGRISPDGVIMRIAQSPDCTGFDGGLDEPGEPIYYQGKLVISCFDLVVDDQKVNTCHEMPATMSVLEI